MNSFHAMNLLHGSTSGYNFIHDWYYSGLILFDITSIRLNLKFSSRQDFIFICLVLNNLWHFNEMLHHSYMRHPWVGLWRWVGKFLLVARSALAMFVKSTIFPPHGFVPISENLDEMPFLWVYKQASLFNIYHLCLMKTQYAP
jgi:hypothetical protein